MSCDDNKQGNMEAEPPGASPVGAGGTEEGPNEESNVSQPEVPAVPPCSSSLLSPSDGGINTETAGESARTGGDTEADSTKKAPVRQSRRAKGLKPLPRISLTRKKKENSITVKEYQAFAKSPDEDGHEDVDGKTSEAPVLSEAASSTLAEAPVLSEDRCLCEG